MQPTHLTLSLFWPVGVAEWTSHKIAAGVEISSPRAWGRVWLPQTARRHQRLRQGLSPPARSVQRGPGARSPELGARPRAEVPGFRGLSGWEARVTRALWAGRKKPAQPGGGCPPARSLRRLRRPSRPGEKWMGRAPPPLELESGGRGRKPLPAAEADPAPPPPRRETPPAFPFPSNLAGSPLDRGRPRTPHSSLLTPALGGASQELSFGRVVDEELPLGQALVEGLLVFLRHGVCAYDEGSGGRGGGGGEERGGASRLKRHSPESAAEGGTAEDTSWLPCSLEPTAPRGAGLPLRPREPDVSARRSQSPRRWTRAATAATTASRLRPGSALGGEDAPPTTRARLLPALLVPALQFPAQVGDRSRFVSA